MSIKRLARFNPQTGLILIGLGLVLAGVNLLMTWDGQRSASAGQLIQSNPVTDNGNPAISGRPVRITVPSLGIDLKVIPGHYYPANQSWTLSLNNAQWGTMTAPANDKQGLTFIYAHYRKGVFLDLPRIERGAHVFITTDNGHQFTYIYRRSIVTSPGDTSLFTYHGKPLLVLQTCTGLWYQNRQLFMLDLEKAV